MPGIQDTGWYQGIKPDTCGISEGTVKKRRRRGGGSAATAEDGVEETRRGEGCVLPWYLVLVGTWYLVPLVPTRYRPIPDARYLRYRVGTVKKRRRCGGGRATTAEDGVEEARRGEGQGPSQRAREVSRRSRGGG
uniref:Uncharacterized protein n=1 Tax=Oryza barthii TaxID=65489 RepID=A0A0D3FLJ6_9ORYZ